MGVMENINAFYKDAKDFEQRNPVQMVTMQDVSFGGKPIFNIHLLKNDVIQTTSSMNSVELRTFIKTNFSSLLANVFCTDKQEAAKYIYKFYDPVFIDAFMEVVLGIEFFSPQDTIMLNTLFYDYITSKNRDESIVSKMITMSNHINKLYVPRLKGLSLSSNLANAIAIAASSNKDAEICVRRVNFILINQPLDLMSDKMLEDIFYVIYGQEIFQVFHYMMFDTIPEYNEMDARTHWVTPEIEEVYSTLTNAMLSAFNKCSAQQIAIGLNAFHELTVSFRKNAPVRCRLKTISSDYFRILQVLQNLGLDL